MCVCVCGAEQTERFSKDALTHLNECLQGKERTPGAAAAESQTARENCTAARLKQPSGAPGYTNDPPAERAQTQATHSANTRRHSTARCFCCS